jgi:membrane protein YqaA with SNARE-associated domain
MQKLSIFIGLTLGSSVGWWLGDMVGPTTAFLLSSVGTFLGVYVGWRIGWDYFR